MTAKRRPGKGHPRSKARATKTRRGLDRSRLRATAPAPLSVAEARSVVRAQVAATAPARKESQRSLVRLARERRRLEAQRRTELCERRRAYDEAYALLSRRGVQAEAGVGPSALAAAPVRDPLRILAEGDSWFEYPVPRFGGGIVPRLARRLGVPIHSLAHAGDEVRFMLGVRQRRELAVELERMSALGTPYDVLLFSGGGNDVVDDPMCLWIRPWDVALSPAQHVHTERFDAVLQVVRAGYEDLIAIRNALSPGTRLLLHAYDFAIPDGRDVCWYGPWLQPTFCDRAFPTVVAGAGAVREMLTRFRGMLEEIALADPDRVTLVETQGTLGEADWHNELHPSKGGFDAIVERFHAKLGELYPGRLP